MALFQRRPNVGDTRQLYSISLNRTVLIAGLGNVGREYDGTRHNIGFACADAFAEANDFDTWIEKKDLKCFFSSHMLGTTRVIIIKPTTFMNLSGEALRAVVNFYKIPIENVTIVHDELDIPFGQIRMRMGGSSAGHNGLKSIIQHLGEGCGRVRIGIGPKKPEQMDTADFVLTKFSGGEQEHMHDLTREVSAILSEVAYGGQLATETRSFLV